MNLNEKIMVQVSLCVKVNKNFAIDLVAEEPVTDIEARVVSCDGGGGALGHPKVYINLVGAFTSLMQSCYLFTCHLFTMKSV